MNTGQWTIVGLSGALAITATILSILSLYTTPSDTTSLSSITGGEVSNTNLYVDQRIVAGQSYTTRTVTPDTDPLEQDYLVEDVGNVHIVSTTTIDDPLPGRGSTLVSAPGAHALQGFPLEVIDQDNTLVMRSTEPLTIRTQQFVLQKAHITPSTISTVGPKGMVGEVGFTGSDGSIGEKGCPCLCISAKGEVGQKGQMGTPGPLGEENTNTGLKGEKGIKGITGSKGIQGLMGPVYVFSKYWDTPMDLADDLAMDPRPSDFPLAGEYGFVHDDGKVYLSDGFDVTEIDDISQQRMRGESGPKGEKGSIKGEKGTKGAHGHTCMEKGEMGLPGPIGPEGVEKGEKGEPNMSLYHGENGDRGSNGPLGMRGPKGFFSMVNFETVTQSTMVVTKSTISNQYDIVVYNPVYSTPVPVWSWGRSVDDPTPTNQEVKEQGVLTLVHVDSLRHGNGTVSDTSARVYFVWNNNTYLSDVVMVSASSSLYISGSVEELDVSVKDSIVELGLFIDNDATPREIIRVSTAASSFVFNTLLSQGQEYVIDILSTDGPICELKHSQGIMGQDSVHDVVLQCRHTLDTPVIVQYIQVNRDRNNIRVTGTFSSPANSVNVYIDQILDRTVSMQQDPQTFDWSCVTSFPIGTYYLRVELLWNDRLVSNRSLPFPMTITADYPPTIRKVTATPEYDIVEGEVSTSADTLEFYSDLGIEYRLDNTTTTFSGSQWLARVPPQLPRGTHVLYCRAKKGSYRTPYSWGFQYTNKDT